MRQLTSLDAQFLNVESPTTVGHVGSLIVVDPATAPDGVWDVEAVRDLLEARLHLAAPLRQRLVEVPLGLGRPYWVDDPHFDLEFHLRELALPAPGSREQLGEQVAQDPRPPAGPDPAAVGGLRHHRPRGRQGSLLLQDPPRGDRRGLRVGDPRDGDGPAPGAPGGGPGGPAVRAAADAEHRRPAATRCRFTGGQPARGGPRRCPGRWPTSTRCRGSATVPGVRLVSEAAGAVGRALGQRPVGLDARDLRAPAHPAQRPDNGSPTLRLRLRAARRRQACQGPLRHDGQRRRDDVDREHPASLAARPRRAATHASDRRRTGLGAHRGPDR